MSWIALAVSAALGGIVQTVTGFGAAIVMMLILPSFMGMLGAPAIVQTICAGLSIPLAIRFWKKVDWKACLPPTVVYMVFSSVTIFFVKSFNTETLKLAFGFFLILLSVYFILFSKKLKLKINWPTAIVVGAVSGICSGLFGIGGPLMALYFLTATDGREKEVYIGTAQMYSALTNVLNLIIRCARGIFTVEMIPMTIAGILVINVGKIFGLKILDRLNAELMRKIVYVFVGVAGLITVLQYYL